jgi:ATP-dependent helicase/nuclease subunit A
MILDQDDRDIARRLLDRNICVEAGAGTGKTTLLTDRLLFLLLAGGKDLSKIAAITFTKKAAAEIKARLSARLHDLALVQPRQKNSQDFLHEVENYFHRTRTEIRESALDALLRLDSALIGTIHQLCSRLLQLYPVEAGVDPFFEVDTGRFFDEIFSHTWDKWLDVELGTQPPRSALWLDVLTYVPLEDLSDLARVLCHESMDGVSLGVSLKIKNDVRHLNERISSLADGKPAPGGRSQILQSLDGLVTHLQKMADDVPSFTPDKPLSFSQWPKAWEGWPGEDVFDEAVSLAKSSSSFSEGLLSRSVHLVQPFVSIFRNAYGKKGHIGFDGLLTQTRTLLRENRNIRQELKNRFDVILVDEFQDTDPLQGEIILYLAEELASHAASWDKVCFAPGKLFVVGDPKQSIYRFRGADLRAYDTFTQMMLTQGAIKCNLQTNFRSHQGLCGPINKIFSSLMEEASGLQPRYHPIHPRPAGHWPAGESPPTEGGVTTVLVPGDILIGESQKAQAAWIARWVVLNCGPEKKWAYGDVALLMRSTTALDIYVSALKDADIPTIVQRDRRFYKTQEVIDFVNLLRVLDNPKDEISLVGLLRSPLGGLTDKEILHLSSSPLRYEGGTPLPLMLSEETRQRLQGFYEFLNRFRHRVGKVPLGDLMADLLRESYLPELCVISYRGEQSLSNLTKLERLAAERGNATLKEFIDFVAVAMDESQDEGENPLADEHRNAVRVLTVHTAKGLEYPVVFLPNLCASNRGGRDRAITHRVDWEDNRAGLRLPRAKATDMAMAFIEKAEEIREEKEWIRLLYVAMTRAKEQVTLMGRETAGDKSSFAALLQKVGGWPDKSLPVFYTGTETDSNSPVSLVPSHPRLLPVQDLWEKWKERFANLKTLGFPSPRGTKVPVGEVPQRDGDGLSVNLSIGDLCHLVLENWDYRGAASPMASPMDQDLKEAITRASRVLKINETAIVDESEKILQNFLASPAAAHLRGCEILGREIPFLSQGEVGRIDLLYRDRGQLWVADYKTDKVVPGEEKEKAEKHQKQGQLYVEAVQKAMGENCGFRVIFLRNGVIV